jgi:hypothetical protein
VVTVKPYLTPDLSEPRRVARYDRTRLTWIDVTTSDLVEPDLEQTGKRSLIAWALFYAALVICAAYVIGGAVPEAAETPTTTAYSHPAPEGVTP